ncbi:unnamed protein product [Arctogadus glacialis]
MPGDVDRYLTRDMPRPEEEEDEEADGAQGGVPVADDAAEDTGMMNMAYLYILLQKTLKSQEREAYKQEQRWRSVQVQLNNVRDELEGERRSGGDGRRPGSEGVRHPVEPPPAVPPYPGPGPADPAVPSPAAWTRAAVPKLEEGDDIEQSITRPAVEQVEAFLAARSGAKAFRFQSFNRSPAGGKSGGFDTGSSQTRVQHHLIDKSEKLGKRQIRVPNTEPDLSHLTSQQGQELRAIIPEGMFSEQPGRTAVVEPDIQLKDSKPWALPIGPDW